MNDTPQPLYQGSLKDVPVFKLLYRLAVAKVKGKLVVAQGDLSKAVFLQNGDPVYIESSVPEERLGTFLVREGKLTQEQLEQALHHAQEKWVQLGDALIALKMLAPHVLFESLQAQVKRRLVTLLQWHDGTYAFFKDADPPPGGMPLGLKTAEILVQGTMEAVPDAEVQATLDRFAKHVVHRINNPYVTLADCKLNARNLRIASSFTDGLTAADTIKNLTQSLKATPEEVRRIMFLMWRLDQITLLEAGDNRTQVASATEAKGPPRPGAPAPRAPAPAPQPVAAKAAASPASGSQPVAVKPPPPPPPTQKSGPVAPVATSPPNGVPAAAKPTTAAGHPRAPGNGTAAESKQDVKTVDVDLSAEALAAMLAAFQEKTFFEIMGVPETGSDADFKKAYHGFAKRYHPDRVRAKAGPEACATAEKLMARIAEAYGVVGEDAPRKEYAAKLKLGIKSEADERRIAKEAEDMFEAEALFKKAVAVMRYNKIAEARKFLEEAIALNPKDPEFRVHLAWTKYNDKNEPREGLATKVQAEIEKAIAEQPKIIDAYLYMGKIRHNEKDMKGASHWFQRCLAVDPGNVESKQWLRRIEAQAEKDGGKAKKAK